MTDRELLAYTGLLAVSGLLLVVLAVVGLGQRPVSRIADGLFGLAFLGYAGFLVWAQPDTIYVFYYAFALPVLLLVHAFRSRRRARARRLAAGFTPEAYDPRAVRAPAERTPFPDPPGPLGPHRGGEPPAPMYPAGLPAERSADAGVPTGEAPSGLPSGLPAAVPQTPATAPERPGRPSGLPGRAAQPVSEEAAYRARHSAAERDAQQPVDRFAQPAYDQEPGGGRHRSPDTDPGEHRGPAPHWPPLRGRPAE